MERGLKQGIPLICLDCFLKIKDFTFAGFLHHGEFLPQVTSEKLFMELAKHLGLRGV